MGRVIDFRGFTEPTADQLDALVHHFAYLTADHTNGLTSNTVLTDITGLSLDLPAGFVYRFATHVYHNSASNTPDLDLKMVFSGTTTLWRERSTGLSSAVSGAGPFDVFEQGSADAATEWTHGTVGADVTAVIEGIFVCTIAGNLKVQAAQNVSNGTVVTVQAGSWLEVWAVAVP